MKIFTNPDKEIAEDIKARVKANEGYCPCRLEHTTDSKCMCKEFREQDQGYCHCGLYLKWHDPKIITICGSTRFKSQMLQVAQELTLRGNIVLMPNVFGHCITDEDEKEEVESMKPMLDALHRKKIDMSTAIYVVNPNGYIGDSTRDEILYAIDNGKEIYYLEEEEI